MRGIGTKPIVEAMARAALDASRGKKGERETLRRIEKALQPGADMLVEVGLDQATIAVREIDPAVNAIAARRKALRAGV